MYAKRVADISACVLLSYLLSSVLATYTLQVALNTHTAMGNLPIVGCELFFDRINPSNLG